ncbi:MAG: hypothetical protein M3Q91_06525 [Acidobacteriota bacterium]|nr:hypothetical protein [Acidobacteriota bacterium]
MRYFLSKFAASVIVVSILSIPTSTPANQGRGDEEQFGPVVRAYLGYLRNEQEVVDDRVSRREVSQAYYRRNSNRIRALRQMAVRIARESRNDYLPELEAVSRDEMGLLFERPPRPDTLREGEVLRRTFRFLGVVRSGESFYIFARLDLYEQSELLKGRAMSAARGSEGWSSGVGTRQKSIGILTRRQRKVLDRYAGHMLSCRFVQKSTISCHTSLNAC